MYYNSNYNIKVTKGPLDKIHKTKLEKFTEAGRQEKKKVILMDYLGNFWSN